MGVNNNVHLIGRLVDDPKFVQGEEPSKNRTSIKLAVKDVYSKEERADFVWCTAWGVHADNISKYCRKGKEVHIEGHLRMTSKKKDDGTYVNYTEVVVDSIHFGADAKSHGKQETPVEQAATTTNSLNLADAAALLQMLLGAKQQQTAQTTTLSTSPADPFVPTVGA